MDVEVCEGSRVGSVQNDSTPSSEEEVGRGKNSTSKDQTDGETQPSSGAHEKPIKIREIEKHVALNPLSISPNNSSEPEKHNGSNLNLLTLEEDGMIEALHKDLVGENWGQISETDEDAESSEEVEDDHSNNGLDLEGSPISQSLLAGREGEFMEAVDLGERMGLLDNKDEETKNCCGI